MPNNKIEQYFHDINGKKIAVVGLGRSNLPLIEFLLHGECEVTGFDKSDAESLSDIITPLKARGVNFSVGENYLDSLENFDIIFRTPGVRPDIEPFKKAAGKGAVITSEMEVFFKLCPAPIFAVTGSDGKTTTTTLIYTLLKEEGYNCFLGGNIGRPLIGDLGQIKSTDMVVLELSSFQLMTIKSSADVAVITNITPNHLDWHISYEEYIDAKKNIYIHPKELKEPLLPGVSRDGRLVLNFDNKETRAIIDENLENTNTTQVSSNIVAFSRQNSINNGTFIEKNAIVFKNGANITHFVDIDEIKIPGVHNVENYMAAIAALEGIVSPETVKKVAKEFNGVEHRIELVRELNGVKIYNDSIASSPTRTIAGLRSFNKKVILIAGGCDKKLSYDELALELIDRVKELVLIGQTATKIQDAFDKARNEKSLGFDIGLHRENSFEDGVKKALSLAKEGDVVILSPASTSFDMFKNFEERGKVFKSIVMSY